MTLTIKTGDWVVLRNGTAIGPIEPTFFGAYSWRVEDFTWMADGKFLQYPDGKSEPLDIIATLPCSPLERIKQLETEMEEAKGGLQALSSYLGAGMGNDDDPVSRFVERIKFGVDEFSNGLERIAEDRANRIRQLEEALQAIERHNDNPAHYDSHIDKLCMEALEAKP